jgi:hypothetical protein
MHYSPIETTWTSGFVHWGTPYQAGVELKEDEYLEQAADIPFSHFLPEKEPAISRDALALPAPGGIAHRRSCGRDKPGTGCAFRLRGLRPLC